MANQGPNIKKHIWNLTKAYGSSDPGFWFTAISSNGAKEKMLIAPILEAFFVGMGYVNKKENFKK